MDVVFFCGPVNSIYLRSFFLLLGHITQMSIIIFGCGVCLEREMCQFFPVRISVVFVVVVLSGQQIYVVFYYISWWILLLLHFVSGHITSL